MRNRPTNFSPLGFGAAIMIVLGFAACDPPGKPDPSGAWIAPDKISDFATLYANNCVACHSIDSSILAASQPMNNPLYVQFAGRDVIERVTKNGSPGTMMPAFLDSEGGQITADQVEIIVDHIMKFADGVPVPPDLPEYAVGLGDVGRGSDVAKLACASCHGADGAGGMGPDAAGSIVDPSYLALVSDQSLKTAVVAGRTDLGMPDYRHLIPNRSLTNQEIDDVVAWMISHRINPSEPLSSAPSAPATPTTENSTP